MSFPPRSGSAGVGSCDGTHAWVLPWWVLWLPVRDLICLTPSPHLWGPVFEVPHCSTSLCCCRLGGTGQSLFPAASACDHSGVSQPGMYKVQFQSEEKLSSLLCWA